MLKRVAVLLSGVLMLGLAVTVKGQSAPAIQYGETVTGEVTSEETELAYTITPAEGDMVVVERRYADTGLFSAAMKITDSSGQVIFDDTSELADETSIAAFRAMTGGDYTVLVTYSQRALNRTGSFALRVLRVQELEDGDRFTVNVTKASGNQYFALPADQALNITYEHKQGDFTLDYQIQVVTPDRGTRRVASATAAQNIITSFSFKTDPDLLTLAVVSVDWFTFQFNDLDNDYELSVNFTAE